MCITFALLGKGQPTVAQQAEMTVDEHSLLSCMRASLPDGFPHYAETEQLALSYLVGSKMYLCLAVACHLHFWQNDRGILHATAVTGMEWTPNKSQHTKLTLEKKILPPLLRGLLTHNLLITCPALDQQAILPP